MVSIPQQDGSVKRFPPLALAEAFEANARRLDGEDVEPHPLTTA